MVCAYCDKEMKEGNIFSNRLYISWIIGDQLPNSLIRSFKKKEQIILCENFLGTPYVKTYYCDNCNKMIIDLNEI